MTMEKREQVFVSSTFKDLVEERRAVIQTLLEADCIPSGMELFPASDSQKWDLIRSVIDLCDYYVVIVGGRYGSIDVDAQLSFTEMEYDYAVSRNIPVMGFLHGSPGKIPGEKIDLDATLREKLDKFREKVESRMVKHWRESGDLPGQVALSLMQIRKSHPAVGWIRANEAMTPEVRAEIAELRAKVRELTAELESEQRHHASGIDPSELVQGDSTALLECTLSFHWRETIEAGKNYANNRVRSTWRAAATWDQIFHRLGPELMDEASEKRLIERLSDLCCELSRTELVNENEEEPGSGDPKAVGAIYTAAVAIESFNDVKVQFTALGLIEGGSKRRPGSDTNTYWILTEHGRIKLLQMRAKKKLSLADLEATD